MNLMAKKILVAEDDGFLSKVLSAKLEKIGFEYKLATDGEEAISILKDFTPDLILLDLVMPKKDGFEVLKDLNSSEVWKKIPVIVTSNLGQPEDKKRAMELGAKDYIVKSDTSLNGIVEKIQEYLK